MAIEVLERLLSQKGPTIALDGEKSGDCCAATAKQVHVGNTRFQGYFELVHLELADDLL